MRLRSRVGALVLGLLSVLLYGCDRVTSPVELSPQGFNFFLDATFENVHQNAGNFFPVASYAEDRSNRGVVRESQLLVELVGDPSAFNVSPGDPGFILARPFRMTIFNRNGVARPVNRNLQTVMDLGDCHLEPEPGFPNGACSVGVRFRSKKGDTIPQIRGGWTVLIERKQANTNDYVVWYRGTF